MKVVIDCRYLGLSGIGRYLEGIIEKLPSDHEYIYYGDSNKIKKYVETNNIIECTLSPFSPKALFEGAKEINKYDCFFTPNFIIPFGIKIPIFSTIHDVIFLDDRTTTNNYLDYRIKKYLLKRATKISRAIFTVSNFSKERIKHYFPKTKNIIITYTGLAKNVLNANNKEIEKDNSIVFVGNLKKNKNIITLLKAFEKARNVDNSLKLFIIGSNNHKTKDEELNKYLNLPGVSFTGKISDDELFLIIRKAKYLVQPSLYEGFGLPPLEALYLKTVPIISNIQVFKEIYEKYPVIFFSSIEDLANKLLEAPKDVESIELNNYCFEFVVNSIFSEIRRCLQ